MRHVIIISPVAQRAALAAAVVQLMGPPAAAAFDGCDLSASGSGEPSHIFAIVPASDAVWAQMQALLPQYPGVELIESDHDNAAAVFTARIAAMGLQRVRVPLPWESA